MERQEAEMIMALFFLQMDCKIIEIYLHLPHFILTDSHLVGMQNNILTVVEMPKTRGAVSIHVFIRLRAHFVIGLECLSH